MKKRQRTLVFFFFLLTAFAVAAQPERVEPPFWWAGMKNPHLQLMVYGKHISLTQVAVSEYPGVALKAVSTLTSPDYLFIDLDISPDALPGTFKITFTSRKGTSSEYIYKLEERDSGSSRRQGFNASDVIYLAMPDRFANGDPANDEVDGMFEGLNRTDPLGRHGGDLQGVINHLDYIRDMGFTVLWLTPVLENNQLQGSYHGYATTDFFKVDPRLGTNELYRELGRQARIKGIKLIMDMIFNHCGSNHWWMKNPPSEDWINHYPGFVPTNHRHTVNEDPHVSQYDHGQMTDGWFVPAMPDLNQRNPFLATYLIQNSIWWIEYAHLAGIRMDTYPYPDKWMMAEWNRRVLEEYPHFNIVGEEWSMQPGIIAYWQRGQHNRDGYQGNLPSLMDFPLQNALVSALTEPENWNSGWIKLYDALAMDFLYPDPGNLVVFSDNHDMPRFYMQVGMNQSLFRMGLSYILTTRGIPQIFYGTEILMTHTEGNGHGVIRKDFPGGWENDTINAFTGQNLATDASSTQQFVKKLLNWRKKQPVIHSGKLIHFAPVNGTYTYFRVNENNRIMIVMNKNSESVSLPLERYAEVLKDASWGRDVISGKSYSMHDSLVVPATTALILEIE
ncbi:MAG: glycoside hydrolase family 13 protein [Chlorobi bacterium]|nr:glycoside hydrolase family 13 protein [Chlorobiota bacterium]